MSVKARSDNFICSLVYTSEANFNCPRFEVYDYTAPSYAIIFDSMDASLEQFRRLTEGKEPTNVKLVPDGSQKAPGYIYPKSDESKLAILAECLDISLEEVKARLNVAYTSNVKYYSKRTSPGRDYKPATTVAPTPAPTAEISVETAFNVLIKAMRKGELKGYFLTKTLEDGSVVMLGDNDVVNTHYDQLPKKDDKERDISYDLRDVAIIIAKAEK